MSLCYTITICRYSDPDSFHRSEALSGDISIARRMRISFKGDDKNRCIPDGYGGLVI